MTRPVRFKSFAAARALAAAALACGLAAGADAAEHRDTASGCTVFAPQHLASNDYVFSYQGGCRDGLAEGKGHAVWALRLSPQNTSERNGRFSAGVFLPEPSDGMRARALKGEEVLFDLGPLPKLQGMRPRLAVQASGSSTELADPCRPYALWVLGADSPALVEDDLAKQLLRSALDKLVQRCGLERLRQSPSLSLRGELRARVVPQAELGLDRGGNPLGAIIEALMPLEPGKAPEQYSNQLASQQRQRQVRAEQAQLQQANAQRLKAFAQPAGATLWVSLSTLAQNPFRFADQVVLTAASLDEVQDPKRARIKGLGMYGAYQFATLQGEALGRWAPGARVLAVRVLGRLPVTDELHPSGLHLQLVAELPCAESDCSDRLYLATPVRDGEAP